MAKGTWIALGVLAAIALLAIGVVGSAVGTYNGFVKESEAIDAQSKQVDVQYQRAFRLVPQITNLSERYVDKTSEAYARIVAMRTGVSEAGTLDEKDAAAANVGTAFNFMIEAYPEIRSDAIYGALVDEIVNTENKIAAEKVRFNDRVQAYNAHRRECCIPLFVANAFGFGERDYIGYADRPDQTTFPEDAQL